MKHLFLPYNLALIAKEKEFDEPCFGYYNPEKKYYHCIDIIGVNNSATKDNGSVSAPLYQQIIDWFRSKYFIYMWVEFDQNSLSYSYQILSTISKSPWIIEGNFTYYEALDKAIEEAFKLIK